MSGLWNFDSVLKKLEMKGYLSRTRNQEDERSLNVSLTGKGQLLHDSAVNIPSKVKDFLPLSPTELADLHRLTTKCCISFIKLAKKIRLTGLLETLAEN